MGKAKKPPVVLHECRYKDEVIEKLKTKDWGESDGLYMDSTHTILFLHDKDAISKLIPFLPEYETAEFFTLLKAPYKEWKHAKVTPYNKEYGLNPAFIIELIRILYGGFSAKIMGEVIIGFLSTAKPIIVSIPYKDDRAVFIIAPALTPDGLEETEIYGERYELDYTIGDKPTYYNLERQIFGFFVDGKIISMDEYRGLVRAKIEPPKIPEKVKIEEKVKIRVLEDIPTFMGTDGEIYKLNKGDIVELPKTNADVLCERGVAEPFVEKVREHEFGIEVYRAGTWHLTHSPGLGYKTYDEAEKRAIKLSEETRESHRVVEYDYEDVARYDVKSYPTVEIKPPEKVPEKVRIHGILKTRYRCPICYRAAPDNFCMVHGDVKAIDILAADESVKEAVIDLTFLDLFKTKYPEKKRWTIEELHDAIGIDTAYAPEFLAKQRPPETYAQYYEHEFGVKMEGVEIIPPELIAKERELIEKRIEKREVAREDEIKEILDSFISLHERMDYPEEFLAHTEEALSLISELPLEEMDYYEMKLTPMIKRAKELLAIPERVPLKFKPGDRVSYEGRLGKILTCKHNHEARCNVEFDDGYKQWLYAKYLEKI